VPSIWEKIHFEGDLCYSGAYEKNCLGEEDHWGDFTRAKKLQNLAVTEVAMDAA